MSSAVLPDAACNGVVMCFTPRINSQQIMFFYIDILTHIYLWNNLFCY